MTFCLIVSLWSGWRESQVRQARFANEDGSMTVGKRCLGRRGFLCVEAQVRQLTEAEGSREDEE
jgi:hypothetical protein